MVGPPSSNEDQPQLSASLTLSTTFSTFFEKPDGILAWHSPGVPPCQPVEVSSPGNCGHATGTDPGARPNGERATEKTLAAGQLDALNFLLADVRDALGRSSPK